MSKQPEKEEKKPWNAKDKNCSNGCDDRHICVVCVCDICRTANLETMICDCSAASPTLEDKGAIMDYNPDNPAQYRSEAPTWEEELREKFYAFKKKRYSSRSNVAKWWIRHVRLAREEAYHQGGHDMDLRVSENFNRALKDESSELVEIIKEAGRSAALEEVEDWMIGNGITHKECFVKLRNFLSVAKRK